MKLDIRKPNISGTRDEQLAQMRSYLFQLSEQLQWAFENVEGTSGAGGGGGGMPTSSKQSTVEIITKPTNEAEAQATFDAIKSLIIKSADIIDAYTEEIGTKLESTYVSESEFGAFQALNSQAIQANSTSITQSFESISALELSTKNWQTGFGESSAEAIREVRNEITKATSDVEQKIVNAGLELQGEIDEAKLLADEATAGVADAKRDIASSNSNIANLGNRIGNVETSFNAELDKIIGSGGAISKIEKSISDEGEARESAIKDINTTLSKFNTTYGEVNTESESYALIIKSGGYVKSGKLYTINGIGVYGIEVGQIVEVNGVEEYRGYARFVSDRISFFDQNGIESAWLSNRRLHATEVEAVQRQQTGGFVDIVDPVTKDVTTVWVEA